MLLKSLKRRVPEAHTIVLQFNNIKRELFRGGQKGEWDTRWDRHVSSIVTGDTGWWPSNL